MSKNETANKKPSAYVAKSVDAEGYAAYTPEENAVWATLIKRQLPAVQNRACDEYQEGLMLLALPEDRIPQCPDVSAVLTEVTGWSLEPVPALIPFNRFFDLLANKKFPAATFIRTREELDYLQEPDIFHEIFGHCPMLTIPACADFTHAYGQLGRNASHEDQVMLAKLYWFTIEFGLIQTAAGMRIYGGGVLSSYGETRYALDAPNVERRPFEILDVLRTPYRIDIMQPIYYVIDSFDVLYQLINMDLLALIKKARSLGMYDPTFPTRFSKE